MILDEKVLMYPPPPPYLSPSSPSSAGASPGLSAYPISSLSSTGKPTLSSLPPHILLEIIYNVFPADSYPRRPTHHQATSSSSSQRTETNAAASPTIGRYQNPNYDPRLYEDTKPERQRRVLFWLSTALRLVSRQLYTACMHVLRSTYLPSYQSLIRSPYSSDPFPLGGAADGSGSTPGSNSNPPAYSSGSSLRSSSSTLSLRENQSPLHTLQRETPVLDRYIALKVRQDVFADDSELHIDREDAYRDLFDVAQPRARLEDLVRAYGVKDGVVSVPGMKKEEKGRQGVYTGDGVGSSSKSSSMASLQISSPTSPTITPTTSSQVLQKSQKQGKTSRSIFTSFTKKKSLPPPSSPVSTPPPPQPKIQPVPFSLLSVSFSPRKVGLIYNRTRTIAEVARASTPAQRKRETLEVLAGDMVDELRRFLEGR